MKNRLVHLDCLRGIAALLVCLEHLRAFLFVPYARLNEPGLVARIFYLVSGLGHQAVMIFFVLSGFLVGGSVLTSFRNGKWSWSGYILRRMSRLWVVLIPALLLTLFWDTIGFHHDVMGYKGAFRGVYNSGPTQVVPADWSPAVFWGNTFFLQTIAVPCFGTNSPLWSLANEFWYYLLFPLLITVFAGSGLVVRIICLLSALMILNFLPRPILLGGLVWFLGAIVYFLIQKDRLRAVVSHPLWLGLSLLMTTGTLISSRAGLLENGSDLAVGVSFAVLVAGIATRTSTNHLYSILSAGISEISYTLYLVHFPIMAFLFFVLFRGSQFLPDLPGCTLFFLILASVLLYSMGVWWCFEHNTDRVRKFIERHLVTPLSRSGIF